MSKLLRWVVEDVAQGSPYGTGTLSEFTPEFKRIASIQGDLVFQGPRRLLLEHLANKQNTWSFGMISSHILICPMSHFLRSSEQHHETGARSRFCT